MTNYTSIKTCAAIGENRAFAQPRVDGRVYHEVYDPEEWLGPGTGFAQRRAFEWGYLGALSAINGERDQADYCHARVRAIAESCGY